MQKGLRIVKKFLLLNSRLSRLAASESQRQMAAGMPHSQCIALVDVAALHWKTIENNKNEHEANFIK
ncbi:hypothetical protein Mgra_00004080 [Meloidogyne graminicola]|uniref:Uncharacterized protein n=1 Tax=Meloidogyne graminicola TaxID=189291 RepID=A0A8S9ZU23_9BILA|nr:hypothetical protein Mgra_00004080 [Meloidogyne graminicola]